MPPCKIRHIRGLPYMTSAKLLDFWPPPPLVTVTNQLILFLLSAFGGPPLPTTHCGRHVWKPPYLPLQYLYEPCTVVYEPLYLNSPSSRRSICQDAPLFQGEGERGSDSVSQSVNSACLTLPSVDRPWTVAALRGAPRPPPPNRRHPPPKTSSTTTGSTRLTPVGSKMNRLG